MLRAKILKHYFLLKHLSSLQSQQRAKEELEKLGFENPRLVVKKVTAQTLSEGPATIRRSIGSLGLKELDPFLLLDHFSVRTSEKFAENPVTGYEVVTYMLQGSLNYEDFNGHEGNINSGDLQWIATGRDEVLLHKGWSATSSEADNVGIQLWINLFSSKDNIVEPKHQKLESKDISRVEKDGVVVKIIAGESFGVCSPFSAVIAAPGTVFLDFTLQQGAHVHQRVPETFNAFVYVIEGEAVVGDPNSAAVANYHALVLSFGGSIGVWNKSEKPLRFLLIAAQPHN